MIQAAINPETKEFLGLIIPKADLGKTITLFGSAEDWDALMRGQPVPKWMVGVVFSEAPTIDADTESVATYSVEPVEVENLVCPPSGQTE